MRNQPTQSVFTGAIWLLSSSATQSVLKAVVTAVLARMISPYDFGVAAAAMSIITLANLINGAGSGSYLVQQKDIGQADFDTVFTYSLVSGFLTAIVVFFLRYPVSNFFNMPELPDIIETLVVIFPVQAFYRVSSCYLQRNMLFKQMAGLDLLSYILSYGVLGLILAALNFGVWALVFAAVAQAVFYALFLYLRVPVKPALSVSTEILGRVIKDGSGYFAINLFGFGARQGDYWVVGNLLGSVQLGYYSRAFSLMTTPHSIFGSVLNKILFARFSRLQDNNKALATTLKRTITLLFLFGIPLSVFFIMAAREIVFILLGPGWEPVILPFQILSIGLIAKLGIGSIINYLLGIGMLKRSVGVYFGYFAAVITGAWVGARMGGIEHVATGVSAALLCTLLYTLGMAFRQAALPWRFAVEKFIFVLFLVTPYIIFGALLRFFLYEEFGLHELVVFLADLIIISFGLIAYFRFRIYRILGEEACWLIEEKGLNLLRNKKSEYEPNGRVEKN